MVASSCWFIYTQHVETMSQGQSTGKTDHVERRSSPLLNFRKPFREVDSFVASRADLSSQPRRSKIAVTVLTFLWPSSILARALRVSTSSAMTSSLRTLPLPPPPMDDAATGAAEAWVLGMGVGTGGKGTGGMTGAAVTVA